MCCENQRSNLLWRFNSKHIVWFANSMTLVGVVVGYAVATPSKCKNGTLTRVVIAVLRLEYRKQRRGTFANVHHTEIIEILISEQV